MTVAVSIHASAVLIGARAVLIRGRSGSGKSRLALELLQSGGGGHFPFVRLVADDRTVAEPAHGRLLLRPAQNLAGLIEVRGLGIQHVPYEPMAVAFLVVDLAAEAARLPAAGDQVTTIEGVSLPRLAIAAGVDPRPIVLAALAAGHTRSA